MKKISILLVFLTAAIGMNAKDITFRIVNENDFPITVWYGLISAKQNVYNDDEMVQKRTELKMAAIGRPLAPGKKTQFNKTDLSGSDIVIVFGLCPGGGRTVVFRYRVKDVDGELDLAFEKIKVIKSNNSYINVAEGLKKTDNLGSYFINTKGAVAGRFVFYNLSAETQTEVYAADRIESIDIRKGQKTDNVVYDLLTRGSAIPVINFKGTLARAVPANDTLVYTEVYIPGIEKATELLAANPNKFLTWKVVGSQKVYINYKDNSYFKLYSTSNPEHRTIIMNRFMKDINVDGSSPFHLFFITEVHRCDSMILIDNDIRKLADYELIEENDLITPSGNFRLEGTNKPVFVATNVVNEVKGIDITPLLCYRAIVQDEFSNTLASAQNCVEVYKYLGGIVELPDLDEKTMSVVSPAYTISKIKEVISAPTILSNIEARILSLAPSALSIPAMKLAQLKFDKM